MVPFILDNGKVWIDMEKEYKYGQTVLNMKECGKTIKLMAKVDSGMPMVIYMKAIGSKIKLMDLGYIPI
jgi:hypothetical protein